MRVIDRIFCFVALVAGLVMTASCRGVELEPEEAESLTAEYLFCPALDGNPASKAIGDAGMIDQLRVFVYKETGGELLCSESKVYAWSDVQRNGVALSLEPGGNYGIMFWAEHKANTAYSFKDDGAVVADYSDYKDAGFARMEELDAFYALATVLSGDTETNRKVVLRRPFAQLNFADSEKPVEGSTAKVTFHSIPYSYNPLTDEVKTTDHVSDADDIVFTFKDFPKENLSHNGSKYHYVSTNYLFAPNRMASVAACTVELEKDGVIVASYEFKGKKAINLEQRKKVNMIGYTTQQPEKWSEWNGQFPTICTLTTDPYDKNCYIIDDAEDIAWLSDALNCESLGEGKTFRLETNIDMCRKSGQRSLKLQPGCTFDGNGLIIKGVRMMVGLFGDKATNLSVRNLTIEDAVVSSTTNAHKGILANSLCGTSYISNVTVVDSEVRTMNAAAGGLVGYVSRRSPEDRSEQMQVVFDDCHLINTKIEANGSEGYFVGMFRGYDGGEKLQFKDDCTVQQALGAQSLNSSVVEGNEAVWTVANDYTKYNAWVGCEECYRGQLCFGDMRYVAKWDGTTAVTPLLADPVYDDSQEHKVTAGTNRFVIYSAFDLAGARKKTSAPKALYFKTSVDMNGQGKDGKYHVPQQFANRKCESADDNWFKTFNCVKTLDGQNNTIYNLCLNSKSVSDSTYISAFIHAAQRDTVTVHKNLIFRNCCSVSPVVQREGAMAGQDLSSASIVVFYTGAEKSGEQPYTMDNIHVYDSQVFALQHSGLLAGIVSGGSVSNCSVNNCYIENYRCTTTVEDFTKKVTIAGSEITISAGFYSFGEIGALVGMIRRESTLTNCHVRNSIIHAYGEPDKEADMSSDGLLGEAAIATAKQLGYFLVPGRHVSTMIGDIRTYDGEKIRINGCTVDAATKCTAEQDHHNSTYPYIGQAYYIQFGDTQGAVYVDGKRLTLADGDKDTKR